MDTSNGHIHYLSEEEQEALQEAINADGAYIEKMVALSENEAEECKTMGIQQRKGWMRNKPCPCGSGKKFKKCCWGNYS